MSHRHTILYIFDRATHNNSVPATIKETGCEVVSTNSATAGVAMLYILGQVDAVVLDSRVKEHAKFDVAQSLRNICPSVPIILQCDNQTDNSRSSTESCVSTDELPSTLQHLLAEEAVSS